MPTFSFEPKPDEKKPTLDELLSRPYQKSLLKKHPYSIRPEYYGTKILKRKLLGICGSKATKSLYELTDALVDSGIASTLGEAERIIPILLDKSLNPYDYRIIIKEIDKNQQYQVKLYRFNI